MKRSFCTVFVLANLMVTFPAFGEIFGCPEPVHVDGQYGPFDYTNPIHFRERLPIVEGAHFNSIVERLAGGARGESNAPTAPAGDIDYTLRAFPNHHRALVAMLRLTFKLNNPKPHPFHFSAECWLERAVRWRPEDGTARMIYGNYLAHAKIKRYDDAVAQYKKAEETLTNQKTMGNLYYNMGLLYFNKKDYEKSRDYADKAYARGFPLSGLKEMLARIGK